jgi:hypothetical protein
MKSQLFFLALVLSCGIASAQTPLLRYTFDEASSGNETALDSGSSPAADGTFTGDDVARTNNTPFGGSRASLNLTSLASPDYVTAGDADKLDGLTQLTLTAWINLQLSPAHGNRIMAKQFGSGNFDGFSFAYNNPTTGTISSTNFQLNLALGGAAGFAIPTSGANLNASNRWLFVAVVYDGTLTSANLKFYSGSETASVAKFGSTRAVTVGPLVANDNEFRVGASSAGGTSAGQFMDDVRVYGAVLTLAQLNAIRLEALPTLAVALAGTEVTLRWPDLAGFQLEYKTNLTSGAWLTNSTPPTVDNGTNALTLAIDSTATFFRLRKP